MLLPDSGSWILIFSHPRSLIRLPDPGVKKHRIRDPNPQHWFWGISRNSFLPVIAFASINIWHNKKLDNFAENSFKNLGTCETGSTHHVRLGTGDFSTVPVPHLWTCVLCESNSISLHLEWQKGTPSQLMYTWKVKWMNEIPYHVKFPLIQPG